MKKKQTGRIDLRGLDINLLNKLKGEAHRKKKSLNELVQEILKAHDEKNEFRLSGHLYQVHLEEMAIDQKLMFEKLKNREKANEEILKRLDRYEWLIDHWLDMEFRDDELFYQDLLKDKGGNVNG